MAKPKLKDGIITPVNLARKTRERLIELSNIANMTRSSYVDWIINKMYNNRSPIEELAHIKIDLEKIKVKQETINEEKEIKIQRIVELTQISKNQKDFKQEFQKELKVRKQHFINILIKNMLEPERDIIKIKEYAKYHAQVLDNRWTAEELMTEATIQYKLQLKM